MARYEDLPYRSCVAVMLINPAGRAFIGCRAGGIKHVDEFHVWQMPQGGVDPGEDTGEAVKRELYEETSLRFEKLGEVDWLTDDIPRLSPDAPGRAAIAARAEMVALRFTARTPNRRRHPGDGHKAEFITWRWDHEKSSRFDRAIQAAGL